MCIFANILSVCGLELFKEVGVVVFGERNGVLVRHFRKKIVVLGLPMK